MTELPQNLTGSEVTFFERVPLFLHVNHISNWKPSPTQCTQEQKNMFMIVR